MPILNVTTKSAKQVWASPDGQRKIYELQLDYDGKPVAGKTYSDIIATVGWSGEAEIYEKTGRNGIEAFVRQAPKENAPSATSSVSTGTKYQPKDEKAIQAMWAIGQVVQLLAPQKKAVDISEIEAQAQELFLMVDRVKTVTEVPAAIAELDEVAPVTDEEMAKINEILEKKE